MVVVATADSPARVKKPRPGSSRIASTFTRFADTPSIGFGPRSLAWGHTIDEYVPVDDLVSCTQALALAAVDYCGVAG